MAKGKIKAKAVSPEVKKQRAHKRAVRAGFRNAGFTRLPELAEKTFKFEGQTGEFDDAFMYENALLLIEYTVHSSDKIKGHLKNKKLLYDKIFNDEGMFFEFLRNSYPDFDTRVKQSGDFASHRLVFRIVYCSLEDIEAETKSLFPEIKFLDFPVVKYFEKIATTIRLSARPELLNFLSIPATAVRENGGFNKEGSSEPYNGSILPEEASGLPKGYKVVSFYADPAALLKRCFVLRRSGWRASSEAYQRMLLPSKIESLRKMVFTEKRVAVNNLIVTLPASVKPVDINGDTISVSTLNQTAPVKIQLPADPESVGIIDGQHRLFAYYVSTKDTPEQSSLRKLQNLLVTGVIFPENISAVERDRFEASLFMSINSNQTSASSQLTQEINVLINPFDKLSIAKQVMEKLSEVQPLFGFIERYFYEKGKLKTTSIVSYGLVPLVKLGGIDSLFSKFEHDNKDKILDGTSKEALSAYVDFCARVISNFLKAVKADVGEERWTTTRNEKYKILTVTYINAFLITIRRVIEGGHSIEALYFKSKLAGISKFDASPFHSSQYNKMSEAIYKNHFCI